MRIVRHMVVAAMLAGLAGVASAAVVLDKDYKTLGAIQPVEVAGKVEVLEFFQYGCSHCYDFEPTMKAWADKKPRDVVFRYVPTVWDESRIPQAKMYYALEEMGLLPTLHEKAYETIHQKQIKLWDRAVLMKWIAEQRGVDAKKFEEVYDSFGVDSKVKRAAQMTKAYQIKGTPTVIVNGKYTTGPGYTMGAGGHPDYARFQQVLDELVAMERPKSAAPEHKTERKKAAK